MAGSGGDSGIFYNPNNGIDNSKMGLDDTTAPGFGRGLNKIRFTRPSGKSFIKWNTAADGSGTDYFPGDDVEHLLGTDANLYAIWGDVPLIIQKSSIEDIADTVHSKKAAWNFTAMDLTALNTNIGSMVPLDTLPNNMSRVYPILGNVWSNATQISTTQNKLKITNYKNGPLMVLITLGTSSTASYSNQTYVFLFKSGSTWLYTAKGYGSNITLVLGETTISQQTYITVQMGSGSRYILDTVFYYLNTT